MTRGAVILVGGKSSRMGQPKALLRMGGESMLERILRIVEPTVGYRVVVAARHQELPTLPDGVVVARDAFSDRGPLQGLLAGLKAGAPLADRFFVCGCDTPFLQSPLIERLFERMRAEDDVVVPEIENRLHPLIAVYHRRVLPTIETLLDRHELRLTNLLASVSTRVMSRGDLCDVDDRLVSLRNVNTPEDYRLAVDNLNR